MPFSNLTLLTFFFGATLGENPIAATNTIESVEYRSGLLTMETPAAFKSLSAEEDNPKESASTGKAFRVGVLRIELANSVIDEMGNPFRSTMTARKVGPPVLQKERTR